MIVIIAVFYTTSLHLLALAGALAAFAAWAVLQELRVRTPVVYVPLAVAAWWFVHESGIHATIAGVVLGLLTRVRPRQGERPARPSGWSTCCRPSRRRSPSRSSR